MSSANRTCDLRIVGRFPDGRNKLRCTRCGKERVTHYAPEQVQLVCGKPAEQVVKPAGPGTELKALLSQLGIRASEGCKCNKRAREMDERGAAWCRENLDTIVGWLEEEAKSKKLPFVRKAARIVVRMAIKRAEKHESRQQAE